MLDVRRINPGCNHDGDWAYYGALGSRDRLESNMVALELNRLKSTSMVYSRCRKLLDIEITLRYCAT